MSNQTTAQAAYNFSIESKGSTHVVTYKKGKYPISMLFYMIIPTAMISAIFLGLMKALNAGTWFFAAFVCPLIAYLTINYLRKDSTFTITNDALVLGEQHYPTTDIISLYLKAADKYSQPITAANDSGGFTVVRTGAVAAAANIGVKASTMIVGGAKNGMRKHIYRNNYHIGFLFGENRIKLASGLTENTALVLFQKVLFLTDGIIKNHSI